MAFRVTARGGFGLAACCGGGADVQWKGQFAASSAAHEGAILGHSRGASCASIDSADIASLAS
ncbi:hypothetical protein GOP47_0017355 [Adiantum capillus-veneris]|uniref:Uncharacterized protein n=1 Tax=Adiantum capillus-veneris TaxID=13818 RepID=A0A9D4UFM6_ADICA|nr:hypothetical protein GOP47_0017355 [Adiantum capillus-veneris]